jgi:ribonuclease HI/retron-type reverse transcriptase
MGKYFDQMTTQNALKAAWVRIRQNGQASQSFDTRAQIAHFEHDADRNIRLLQSELHSGRFKFDPQTGVLKQKPGSTKKRGIVMASVRNRIVERAILDCLQAKCSYVQLVLDIPTSIGGVPFRSVPHGLKQIQSAFDQGAQWFARSDIAGFFDNIPRGTVITEIGKHVDDQEFMALLERATTVVLANEAALGDDRRCFPTDEHGVAQGSPLSPLCGNILLHEFDRRFNGRGITCVRFIDDFVLLGEAEGKVEKAFVGARDHLASLGLTCHDPYDPSADRKKSGRGRVSVGFDFLGYRIEPGLRQPSSTARQKLLAAVDEQLQIGRRGINDCIREVDSLAHRQRYAQTHDMLDRVIKGWGNAFQYGNSKSTLGDIDRQIDAKLKILRQWFARRTHTLSDEQRRRAGGVCLLVDLPSKHLDDLPFQLSRDRKRFRRAASTVVVSTDGSVLTGGLRRGRDKGPGGWAFLIHGQENGVSGGSADVTNNHMEILAVIMALRQVPPGGSLHIRTDSRYVAGTYNSCGTVRSNLELWRELQEFAARRPIKIEWIKGHAGDPHNELVDQLAQQAAESVKSTPRRPVPNAA